MKILREQCPSVMAGMRCCSTAVTTGRLTRLAVLCVLVTVTLSQNADNPPQQPPIPVTDPTILITPAQTANNSSLGLKPGSEAGETGEEGGETAEGGGGGAAAGGGEAAEGAGEEAAEGGGEGAGAGGGGGGEGAEGAGEGAGGGEPGEGPEGPEAGEGAEGTEPPEREEAEEAEGGREALEDRLEDLVELYRQQGLTASIEALATAYPNMTGVFNEREEEGEEREAEGAEHDERLRGSEGGPLRPGHPGYHHPLQSLASDFFGDYYEEGAPGPPAASYAFRPYQPEKGVIEPTRVAAAPNSEGGQARLRDDSNNPAFANNHEGPFGQGGGGGGGGGGLVRHPTGMTASATFGVVVGTVLLSWLIVGPVVCLAWRWNERRRERKKTLLQRPHLHGSVDEGIMDAMVMSELGRSGSGPGGSRSARRQRASDVEATLARNRSELLSFPTTTTLTSVVD